MQYVDHAWQPLAFFSKKLSANKAARLADPPAIPGATSSADNSVSDHPPTEWPAYHRGYLQ